MTTTATLQKWGNSLGIRIPAQFAKTLNMEDGTEMQLILTDKEIVIRPKVQAEETSEELRNHLRSLLAKAEANPKHHEEIDFGIEGNERI